MIRGALALLVLGACSDPHATPPDATVLPSALPSLLSQTGLYTDFAAKTLSPRLTLFAPNNVLWSDGAMKLRWFELPDSATIDSSDMDHWKFPVGARFFKEFSLGGKRLETRLIWRVADTGDFQKDALVGAYVWNDDESEATFAPDGAQDIRGTDHDAPSSDMCWKCHVGEEGHVLGLSALQTGDVSQLPLSVQPADPTPFAAPNAALGYLHANCGHCHNPHGLAWSNTRMILRLDVGERDPATTQIVKTTVGIDLDEWLNHGFTKRIVPGDPSQSEIFYRMSQRAMNEQMPPLATEITDPNGLALIEAWIQSL